MIIELRYVYNRVCDSVFNHYIVPDLRFVYPFLCVNYYNTGYLRYCIVVDNFVSFQKVVDRGQTVVVISAVYINFMCHF